jgi:hypothetical protein
LPIGETIEFLKAHDQRLPFVGIDLVRVAVDEDGRIDEDPLNAHFKQDAAATGSGIALGQVVDMLDDRLHLDRTFPGTRRIDGLGRKWG